MEIPVRRGHRQRSRTAAFSRRLGRGPVGGDRALLLDNPTSAEVITAEDQRRIHPIWPIALVGLAMAGYVKGLPALADLGIDLTGLFLAVAAVGAALHLLRRSADTRGLLVVAAVWATFVVGMVIGLWTESGPFKILLLVTVTLFCAIAPVALLRTPGARRCFLGAVLVIAALMAIALVVYPDQSAQAAYGRLTLEGSNSVGTARVVGAGAVSALVIGLATTRFRIVWLSLAAALCAVTVFVGSRGPFVALVVSAVIVLLTAKTFRGGRKVPTLVIGALALLALLAYVTQSNNRAASRIALLLTGESVDENRLFLVRHTLSLIRHFPIGIGWGGFASAPTDPASLYGRFPYPHNIFLEVVVEGGWIAGAAIIVLFCLSVRGFVQQSASVEGAALFAVGLYWMLVAQTSGDVNANRMTWVLLMLGVVLYERRRWRPAYNRRAITRTGRIEQAAAEPEPAQSASSTAGASGTSPADS